MFEIPERGFAENSPWLACTFVSPDLNTWNTILCRAASEHAYDTSVNPNPFFLLPFAGLRDAYTPNQAIARQTGCGSLDLVCD